MLPTPPADSESEPFRLPALEPPYRGALTLRLHPRRGGPEALLRLGYSLQGDVTRPWRVVLGGISASATPGGSDGWWHTQVGAGRAIDPADGAVLGLEYIGAPPAGWRGVDSADQADALAAALDVLGADAVAAVIGASYGGCVALAFAARHPHRAARVLAISAADRPAPMSCALRALQRTLLRDGLARGETQAATALARALAITTYRSEREFAERFDGEPVWRDGRWRWPVEDYLDAQGQAFAARFDAARYLALSESLDLHRVDPSALDGARLHLLAVAEDRLVPAEDVHALAARCGAGFSLIHSRYGHDAFLKEDAAIADWLRAQLTAPERMRGRALPA